MDGRERPCGGFSHLKTTQGLASAGSETFRADKSGSVAVTAAISLAAVLMVAGLAIDLGHWNSARTATVAAFDAAVLAGGRALQLGKSRDDAIALARKYYFENVQHRTSFLADSINFSVADNRLTLSAAGNVTLSTPFLGLTGRRAMALLKGTDLNRSTARIASGRYARENLEVALVLDTSAAMRGEKLSNLKDAASDFVRLMVWDDQSQYRSRLALIPFASAVRPPEARLEAVRGQPPFHRHRAVALRIWNGILPFDRLRRRTPWHASLLRRRPWCGRSVPWRLHPDRNLCHGSRLDLKPFNGRQVTPVAGHRGPRSLRHVGRSPWLGLGLVCTVTELWAPVWQQSGAAPDAYGQDGTRKIAIFMTGSDFDTQYSDEGLVSSEQAALPGASSDQSIQLCQEMKQAGIEIFTIGYALPENARVTTVLDNCASSTGMAYHPNHGDELRQAFRSIAVRVIDLHLVN